MTEQWTPPKSYVLKDSDWADMESLLNAHNPGDDHWVQERQRLHREELARGTSSVELVIYCLAVSEKVCRDNRVPVQLKLQAKAYHKRLRTEIWRRRNEGEP
jgi:hypothetical protein